MSEGRVRRRHVFFLSGFDPKGAAHYHALYAREARLQAGVTGASYEVGPRTRLANGNSCWRVLAGTGAAGTQTCMEYVRWDDIVRAHWPRGAWQVLRGALSGYAAALASPAALRVVARAAPRTLVALVLPALFWLAALAIAMLAGGLVLLAFRHMPAAPPAPVLAASAAAAAGAVLWGVLRWERTLNTTWLLRIYQFAAAWRSGRTPLLQQRLEAAANDVRRKLADDAVDEVLLVGFSVGSLLAASIAARVQQSAAAHGTGLERLRVLTLGHCVPLLGLMAGADAYRAELARLGRSPRIRWYDFSSPTDWGSFALVDPIALSQGSAPPHAPRMASPRFHTMFPPQEYARLVRNKRRLHMQYLMAGRQPAAYDYFAITAGPLALPQRFPPAP